MGAPRAPTGSQQEGGGKAGCQRLEVEGWTGGVRVWVEAGEHGGAADGAAVVLTGLLNSSHEAHERELGGELEEGGGWGGSCAHTHAHYKSRYNEDLYIIMNHMTLTPVRPESGRGLSEPTWALVKVGTSIHLVLCCDWLPGDGGGPAVGQRPPHLRSLLSGLRPVHAVELRHEGTWCVCVSAHVYTHTQAHTQSG